MKLLYQPHHYSQQRQRQKPSNIWPVLLAMEATYRRNEGHEVLWGPVTVEQRRGVDKIITEPEGISFLSLPRPDRIKTDAFNPIYQKNGNFKHRPGTYIQAANGCWHGKCSFCVENKNKWEVRPVDDVITEIKVCEALGFREVFDDSGTFPIGGWLDEFLAYGSFGVRLGCNMRLVSVDYRAMRESGFRMLLFGLESANQKTLDKINKGIKVQDYKYIIKAAKAGLEPHIAVMFGYPWETDADALNTLKLVHWLLRKGYAKTAQASVYRPVTKRDNEKHSLYVNRIYHAAYSLEFWMNKLRDIKCVDDIKYLWLAIKKGLGNGYGKNKAPVYLSE